MVVLSSISVAVQVRMITPPVQISMAEESGLSTASIALGKEGSVSSVAIRLTLGGKSVRQLMVMSSGVGSEKTGGLTAFPLTEDRDLAEAVFVSAARLTVEKTIQDRQSQRISCTLYCK